MRLRTSLASREGCLEDEVLWDWAWDLIGTAVNAPPARASRLLLDRSGGSWAIWAVRLRETVGWRLSGTAVSIFPFISTLEVSVWPRRGEDAALSLAWAAALLELLEPLCWVDDVRGGATGGMVLRWFEEAEW